jgi:hypothetical protein
VKPAIATKPRSRFGLEFPPDAYGGALHLDGRAAILSHANVPAQQALEKYWEFAHSEIRALGTFRDLRFLQRIVAGTAPLEIERSSPDLRYYDLQREKVEWTPPAAGAEEIPRREDRKKKRKKDDCCRVRADRTGYRICVHPTGDPQTPLISQEPAQGESAIGRGIRLNNGAFSHYHVDYRRRSIGFDFAFTRNYRSEVSYDGVLGLNWDHCYNVRVVPEGNDTGDDDCICEIFPWLPRMRVLRYHDGTGRVTRHRWLSWTVRKVQWCTETPGTLVIFTAIVSTYSQNPGEDFEIQRYAVVEVISGELPRALEGDRVFYRVRYRRDKRIILNCYGYMVELRDRHYNVMIFVYRDWYNVATRYYALRHIFDTQRRRYDLEYTLEASSADGSTHLPIPRIKSLTDVELQLTVEYKYRQTRIELERVNLIAGRAGRPSIAYLYRAGRAASLLTEIVKPNEIAAFDANPTVKASWLENEYDAEERVIRQREGAPGTITPAAGGERSIAYSNDTVTCTTRDRAQFSYTMRPDGLLKEVKIRDAVFVNGQYEADRELITQYEYDDNCHRTVIVHPSGRKEKFTFRPRNRAVQGRDELDDAVAQIAHYNDLSRDDLLHHSLVAPDGSTLQTDYEWEPLFNSLKRVTSPLGLDTIYHYNHGHSQFP